MTDRDSLLAAIRANPRDDLPRLVYADWLDENGTTDLDVATSEFIRKSVAFKGKQKHPVGLIGAMAPAGYEWLHDNWSRLVPGLMRHTPVRNFRRTGRRVRAAVYVPKGKRDLLQFVWVDLEFNNLGVSRAWWWGCNGIEGNWVYQLISRDQPDAAMASIGTPAWKERERLRAKLNARRERERQNSATGFGDQFNTRRDATWMSVLEEL